MIFLLHLKKKNLDKLLAYLKYYSKIVLEQKKKNDYNFLYKTSFKKLDRVERYFNS